MAEEENPEFKPASGPVKTTLTAKLLIICVLGGVAIYFLPLKDIIRNKDVIRDKTPSREFLPERKSKVRGKLLLNDAYVQKLKNDLLEAEKSIWVFMYIFKLGDKEDRKFNPAYHLARILRKKAQGGVEVKVALSTVPDKPQKDFVKENRRTAKFLRKAGVEVAVQPAPGRLHAKAVMIDRKKLFVANHNWTFSALKYNAEVAMYFEGPGIINKIPSKLQWLKRRVFK